mgnify:CR=1 FL=1
MHGNLWISFVSYARHRKPTGFSVHEKLMLFVETFGLLVYKVKPKGFTCTVQRKQYMFPLHGLQCKPLSYARHRKSTDFLCTTQEIIKFPVHEKLRFFVETFRFSLKTSVFR